jgi:hypothetical protein
VNPFRPFAVAILAAALCLCAFGVQAQEVSRSDTAHAAYEELAEALIRGQLYEQRRILPRQVPDEVRAMVKRETARARRSVAVAMVTCLVLLFLFAFPLLERDKEIAPEHIARKR